MALKVVFEAFKRSGRISSFGIAASVVIKQSIVAKLGLIIPAPLHIAPILKLLPSSKKTSKAIVLLNLSVVIIALAAF